MATQPRLPGTLPTPSVARSNLRDARYSVRNQRMLAVEAKEHVKRAKDDLAAAAAAVETAEDDLDKASGDAEVMAADGAHELSLGLVQKGEAALVKVSAVAKRAADDLGIAEKRLAAAREDLRAIRQGRRTR
jgi:hypothetical protein